MQRSILPSIVYNNTIVTTTATGGSGCGCMIRCRLSRFHSVVAARVITAAAVSEQQQQQQLLLLQNSPQRRMISSFRHLQPLLLQSPSPKQLSLQQPLHSLLVQQPAKYRWMMSTTTTPPPPAAAAAAAEVPVVNTDETATTMEDSTTTNIISDVTTTTISPESVKWIYQRKYMQPDRQLLSPRRSIPKHIIPPMYASVGDTISSMDYYTNINSITKKKRQPYHDPTTDPIPLYPISEHESFIQHMRNAGQIAATTLALACNYAQQLVPSPTLTNIIYETDTTTNTEITKEYLYNTKTTDDIDALVHTTIVDTYQSYPSPLNYATYPKSVCTSINEIICHGIPECYRELQYGDVVSIDVSCYTKDRVHGDNCATIIVGDTNDIDITTTMTTDTTSTTATAATIATTATNQNNNNINNTTTNQHNKIVHENDEPYNHCDWRNVPVRTQFASVACQEHFIEARRLMYATRLGLMTAIQTIVPNQSYISDVGHACQNIAEQYGYSSVTKYRGHGIGNEFHMSPFIKHYTNTDHIRIEEGMIFTIEPMFCQYSADCDEWVSDQWTVTTLDRGLSCQFEHTIYVTATGVEILTLPFGHDKIGRDYYTTTTTTTSTTNS